MKFTPVSQLLEIPKYQRIVSLRDERPSGHGVDFTACCEDGTRFPAQLRVISPDTICLQIGQRDAESVPVAEVTGDTAHKLSIDGNTVSIQTACLTLTITRNPWRMVLRDANGKRLTEDAIEDRSCYSAVWEEGEADADPKRDFLGLPLGVGRSDEGRLRFTAAYPLEAGEAIYGLGEKFGPLNKAGQRIGSRNDSCCTGMEGTNCAVPFWLSTRGYGCFIRTRHPVLFDIGAQRTRILRFALEEESLELYFFARPRLSQIVSSYTALTGRLPVPAPWTFGVWWSRCTYWRQDQVLEVARRMRQERIPCDVLRIDNGWMAKRKYGFPLTFDFTWDEERFPDPDAMLRELKALGFKTCLWVAPRVVDGSAAEKELTATGSNLSSAPAWNMSYFDFSNPPTREWYKGRLTRLLKQGADTFFLDVGMEAPEDLEWKHWDGISARQEFAYAFNQLTSEALEAHHGVPVAHWALAGSAGTQKFPARCGGDARSTHADNASALRGGLSSALCGYSLWGCDLGGFGTYPGPPPEKEFLLRSYEYGAFLPMMFCHGAGQREPWTFDENFLTRFRELAELRYRLLPYFLKLAEEAHVTGVPMLRPLVMEFQEDPTTWNIDDCFMLGDALLVIPVLSDEQERVFYLPHGQWRDFWTDESLEGGRWVTVKLQPDRSPVYQRMGHEVPLGEVAQYHR